MLLYNTGRDKVNGIQFHHLAKLIASNFIISYSYKNTLGQHLVAMGYCLP